MRNTYLFSLNEFDIKCGGKIYRIDKNRRLLIKDLDESLSLITNSALNCECKLDLTYAQNCKHLKINNLGNDKFVEIISAFSDEVSNKYTTSNCEIFIYENHVEVCYNSRFYSYYYLNSKENYVLEIDDVLYVFNELNELEFDLKNKSFFLKKCKKMAKNDEKTEILCEIPYNNAFFILLSFDKKNKITKKVFKKGSLKTCDTTLPLTLFYMVKANIKQAKDYLQGVDYEKLQGYFAGFNHIIEIDGKYYLCGNNFCEVQFTIQNGIVIDID